jgi:hypothetical protein
LIEIEDNMGIAEGMDKVKAFFNMYQGLVGQPGVLVDHEATCPVIEIAKDGKTAQATYLSPGLGGEAAHSVQLWNWGVLHQRGRGRENLAFALGQNILNQLGEGLDL